MLQKLALSSSRGCLHLLRSIKKLLFSPGRCGDFKVGEPKLIVTKYNYRIDTPFGKVVLFEDPEAKPEYRGRSVTRQIECDVWQQTRVNWPGSVTGKQVWKWYFTQKTWVENKEPQPVS